MAVLVVVGYLLGIEVRAVHEDVRSLVTGELVVAVELLDLVPVHDRTHERVLVEGVADGDVLREADEPSLELLVVVGVDDQSLAGDTPLAGGLERGHHRRVDGRLQVRVGGDHDRVLPAHLA